MVEENKMMDSEVWLDEVLKSDPGFVLPDNFAEDTARKVARKFAWRQYLREFWVYLVVIAAIAMVSVVMAFWWFNADWKRWLDMLAANAVIVAGLNLLLVFVLFADRVLLRYFMYRTSES